MLPAIKVIGWAPDIDPITPGVLTDCEMLEPSIRGMRAAPSAVSVGADALAAECRGAALVQKLDGTRRLIAGTQTKLYELSSTTWVDRSSGTYTGSSESRWQIRQFGDTTIATNGVDDPQESTSGAFAAMTEMPKAKLVETVDGFVMAANITESGYVYPDAWWCSALYDHADWTLDVATQSARGRLTEAPGPINALRALGGDVCVFKERSIIVGRYVGTPTIWAWQAVPGEVGCVAADGVASDGSRLFFWGGDDFYAFDGSRPAPIGQTVRKWFAANSNPLYLNRMTAQYDRLANVVRWWYAGAGSTTLNRCIVFHPQTGVWGRADRSIEAVVDYRPGGLTFASPGVLTGATFADNAYLQTYDSPLWTAGTENPAVFSLNHVVQTLTGVPGVSSMKTGMFGDDDRVTLLRRVRARYADSPDSAEMTEFYSNESGGFCTAGTSSVSDDGKHDFMRASRWHCLRAAWTGSVEITGYAVDVVDVGVR
jgi:hypothetical protein